MSFRVCNTNNQNNIVMKLKHLLIGLFAAAAAVACKPDEVVETPKLDVDKSAVSLAATAGEASFSVTSNQDWTASADADWVSVDPATGKASDKAVKVAVTAEDNETTDARSATVTVKAGSLTKTVKVTQAAGQGEEPGPGPEPGPDAETYLLVGDAVGGWNFDNPVVLTLADGYYVAKEVGVTGEKDMHFTKNSSWEGNVKGLHGRIAPNEIGEVGNNNISLTVGGAYDIYLTEALDKFYFMTPGKLPSEAVEHVEIATVWGVCGALDGNSWGASSDPVLTAEGEWLVARNIVFTEVNFKVRGNNTWADDLKWGRTSEDQVCELNKAIAVSTCTEYRAANPEAGDNPNIYIGGSGTYDVYFSEEKKEVWVMTPGYKPGDETPAPPVTEKTYTVTGTIEGHAWENGYEGGLMTAEGDYLVARNLPLVWGSTLYDDNSNPIELKVLETGTWNGYGAAEEGVKAANTEIAVAVGGGNIIVDAPAGTYDVYFDKTNEKVWVMTAGSKPGETPVVPEPDAPAVTETIWEGEPFDLGSDWSQGLQISSVPRLPEDARIHIVYEAPAGYDYYQVKFCSIGQDWNWNVLTSPTGMNADGCVTLDAAATEYSFALNAEDIAAINTGRGMVVQGYATVIKKVYYTSDIEVGDGPKLVWEGRCELLSDWSTSLQLQSMPFMEDGMSIYVEYEAAGYDYYQFKFCYIDENWGWNAMSSPADVNEYDCVTLDPAKTEYVLTINAEDAAAINAGNGMVIQGYGAVITKVSYK